MQDKEDFLHIATLTARIQERRVAGDLTNVLMYVLKSLNYCFC